jgi:hypothetical protein
VTVRRGRAPVGTTPGVVAVLLSIVLAGCLGSEATAPPATPTAAPIPTARVTTYPLETKVWAEGFVVTFHSATASLDAKGGPVTVLATIANPGTEAATLDSPIRLTASGAVFELVHGTELPEIPAAATLDVSLPFEVVGRSSIDDGVLRIGRSADHTTKVPFTTGPVPTLTLEPNVVALNGTTTTPEGIRLALHRRETRWDLPDWHQELPLATEALTLTYDVAYTGTFFGGVAFTEQNVTLRLPNGTVVAPRRDGHSQSILVISPNKTAKNLFSRFEIPNGTTGLFRLIVNDGTKKTTIAFRISA